MQAECDSARNVGVPVKVGNNWSMDIIYKKFNLLYVQALVNVPALSECTIRRDVEKANVSIGSETVV